MKDYQTNELRNIAVVGHASAGKTMLCEAMLVCGGAISRLGSVVNGTTVSDYSEIEHARQISVQATLMHVEWQGKVKINIMDTPGYLDFISESLGALRVADNALVVVHANHGPGVGTSQVWETATANGVPKLFAMNALDKEQTNFDQTLAQLRERFGARIFPLTLPLNAGPGFNQVLDVLRGKVLTYAKDGVGKCQEADATGAVAQKATELKGQIVECIAESDDALMEKFFEQGSLSEAEIQTGLHSAFVKQSFVPLFAVAAETNIGVMAMMEFIAAYGATPLDHPKTKAQDVNGADIEIALTDPDPTIMVYKTMNEAQVGETSYFKVFAAGLKVGQELYNSNTRSSEKFNQIYVMNGKNRVSVTGLCAGDIAAAVKLKATHTGDTLVGNSKKANTLPKVVYPKPNIHAALRPKVKGEEDKIAEGLASVHSEDPAFLYHVDSELHQTVISGQGDLHLDVVVDRLRRRYKVELDLIEPRIPFRETIKGKGDSKYRHKKQTGGAGQFAEVWMRIEPRPRNSGVEFVQSLVGQNVDRSFVPSVEKGVNRAVTEGVLAGYRVVDVKIEFYDGKMHPVDSKDIAFQIAGYEAFKESFNMAKSCMLEPICIIEVRTPDDCMGNVIGDLSSRRGKIQGMDSDGSMQVVKATVPQMQLYRYSSVLRSLTGGRGMHKEEFSHYEEMPRELEQKVIADSKKAKEEKTD